MRLSMPIFIFIALRRLWHDWEGDQGRRARLLETHDISSNCCYDVNPSTAKVASVYPLWLCVMHHSYSSSYIFSDFALKFSLMLHKLHQYLLFLNLHFVLMPEQLLV